MDPTDVSAGRRRIRSGVRPGRPVLRVPARGHRGTCDDHGNSQQRDRGYLIVAEDDAEHQRNHRYHVRDDRRARRPDATDKTPHDYKGNPGTHHACGCNRDERSPSERTPRGADQTERSRPQGCESEHPGHHRDRSIPLLDRCRDVHCESVARRGDDHEGNTERFGASFPNRRGADGDNAGEPDHEAHERRCPWEPTQHDDRDDGCEDRHGPVQHAGNGGVDVLLCNREEGEWDCHPHDRESDKPWPVGAVDFRGPCHRDQPECSSAQAHPKQGDQTGLEGLEADRHQEKGRAPNQRDRHEQRPVEHGEGAAVHAL